MTYASTHMINAAAHLLGRDTLPLLERIAECEGGIRYLTEKIVNAKDANTRLDDTRVLKYAHYFYQRGGVVTFVPEERAPTPDLRVMAAGHTFYVEVKKFRMPEDGPSRHSIEKVVSAVENKRRQLPRSQVGFVAIDNFDIHLEPGFGYDVIREALCEMHRRASANPNGWRKPSGVIVAASTSMGSTPSIEFPHFLWTNDLSVPASPANVTSWLLSSLPSGRAFLCAEGDFEAESQVEQQSLVETLEF